MGKRCGSVLGDADRGRKVLRIDAADRSVGTFSQQVVDDEFADESDAG